MSFASIGNLAGSEPTDPALQPDKAASDEKLQMEYGNELVSTRTVTAGQPKGVSFAEYLHYAKLTREHESQTQALEDTQSHPEKAEAAETSPVRKRSKVSLDKQTLLVRKHYDRPTILDSQELQISSLDKDKLNARRMLRQAGWSTAFFLITTDILGPFNAPYAVSTVGYVPGCILYFVFGVVAFVCGIILNNLFTHLDSDVYPVRTYGDIGERLLGTPFRYLCTFLQTVQLIINVGSLVLTNGQALEQLAYGPNGTGSICFSIAIVIWAFVGMIAGQIRTLRNIGIFANMSVFFNLLIIFTSMGFVAHSPPNYASANAAYGIDAGPVITQAFVSADLPSKVNGVFNMVFAYGGAMIFPEIMAEMRRPMDFWKGMACAQLLIFTCYMTYGVFVYAFQGQFTLPQAFQGVSYYSWQSVGNTLNLVTGTIAAVLYGNIGAKVAYINIVENIFHGPPLTSKRGRMIWSPLVIVYWSLAFVVGSAIPQVQTISGLIAALAILHFTYSFPFLLQAAFSVRMDAAALDGEFVPGQDNNHYHDTWRQWSRWRRGLFGGKWYYKAINFILFLACLAMSGLGLYGSGLSIAAVFETSAATSFGCDAPV